MTIDKAIKELEIAREVAEHEGLWGRMAASQLGIEALKLMDHLRQPKFLRYLSLLPGETEE